MNNQEIVAKLWNLCNVLRDDGITYHQYVTELTYILFLKMCKETGTEGAIPEQYRWDKLLAKQGVELKKFYKELLEHLGESCTGRVREIYQGAQSNIDEPKNLEKIIQTIDQFDWYTAKEEGLGNLYEGLLEKNANEKKSGAGQYFTPRVLINIMTRLVAPQPGERCNDPACGTFGFMIAADRYVKDHTDDLFELPVDQQEFQRTQAFSGCELVHDTHRLALMNAMLHDISGPIYLGDTLSNFGKGMKGYDVVLTNPPFGTKKGGERATRDDFTFPTSNKQLNFLQHIYRSLNKTGKARAAVVLPDNVLFADGDGELLQALQDYDRMRKEKRKSLTDTMRRSLCQQLDEEFHRCEWVQIIKQATRQGWLKFYPLDKDKPASTVPEFESAGDQISRIIENLKRKNGA